MALTTALHVRQAKRMTPNPSPPPNTNTHRNTAPIPQGEGLSSQALSVLKPLENRILRVSCGTLSAVYFAELYY